MSIKIGNNNKISKSIISENTTIDNNDVKKNFFQRHQLLSGIFIAVVAGFILMLPFWNKLIVFIKGIFSGK